MSQSNGSQDSTVAIDGVRPLAVGAHTKLWPLENRHISALQAIVCHPEIRSTWRTRGDFWAPYEVQAHLARALVSAVATAGGTGDEVLGLVELLDPDLLDRRVQLSLVVSPKHLGTGVGIEMAMLFLNFAFDAYPIDKVCVETQARNRHLIAGLRRILSHEGTFKRHLNIHGEWHDVEAFALWRHDMPGLTRRLLPARNDQTPESRS